MRLKDKQCAAKCKTSRCDAAYLFEVCIGRLTSKAKALEATARGTRSRPHILYDTFSLSPFIVGRETTQGALRLQ